MTYATPRPWKIFRDGFAIIGEENGEGIVSLWREGAEREANAALILRAVNNIDKVVAALDGLVSDQHGHLASCPCPWCAARAALAAAKEAAP